MPQLIMDDEDGVIAMLRESVAAFAEGRPGPQSVRAVRKAEGDMDVACWSEMAGAGWIGLMLPEELGGAGLGIRHQAILSEALGQALIQSPVATASVLSSGLLVGADATSERARLAGALASGSAIVVPALQDSTAHAGVKATSADDVLILDGRKEFVEAASSATDFLITTSSGDGHVLVSVPADAAGIQRIDRPGVDGATVSVLVFSGCRVSRDNILKTATDVSAIVDGPVDLARIALSAELSGIASRAFDMTSSYTKERVQFGKPIASFQVIQHRLVDLWMEAEFACASVVNAIERSEGDDPAAAHLAILAAKARASDAASLIGRRAIHLYGAMGFTDECDIGLYLKRAINLGAMLGQAEGLRLQFVVQERAA